MEPGLPDILGFSETPTISGYAIHPAGLVVHEDELDGYRVRRYRPRIEGLFARIERWSKIGAPSDVHWRSLSKDNILTPGESGEGFHAATRLARKSSSQPAVLRLRRRESFPGALRIRLLRHVLERGEVGGRVFGSHAAFVVAKDHVHDPMQAVLDRPMVADHRADQRWPARPAR